tara:strand:+ start:262 stop:993 length:732 start_codon:yes stop_codon:yes gene_type:complete
MADRNTKKGCNEELYVKETWSMDRTIGKSQKRNYDGERLMKILKSYKRMMAEFINEADVDDEKIIKYKTKDGEPGEMKAGSAKTMPKDHPAKISYDKMQGDGDDSEKDSGGKLSDTDFDRDGNEDDNDKSDDVEISDANSGPIDTDDIMDMLKNDSEVVDKMGDDVYWDGMDLVSSKYDDDTIASIPDDASMTLADLKKQIMDYEEEQDESIKVIDGKKYKPIKESKKHPLKENYDRIFRSRK